MQTCNFIFWSVVVPIATYDCKLLIITDNHINLLEEFQEYTGKKMQRFYSKTPRVCTFFALGWIRLERYIEVKKLLFFPVGTERTMYVHCTYIVPTVRTMYVHCTYSARWVTWHTYPR